MLEKSLVKYKVNNGVDKPSELINQGFSFDVLEQGVTMSH